LKHFCFTELPKTVPFRGRWARMDTVFFSIHEAMCFVEIFAFISHWHFSKNNTNFI